MEDSRHYMKKKIRKALLFFGLRGCFVFSVSILVNVSIAFTSYVCYTETHVFLDAEILSTRKQFLTPHSNHSLTISCISSCDQRLELSQAVLLHGIVLVTRCTSSGGLWSPAHRPGGRCVS